MDLKTSIMMNTQDALMLGIARGARQKLMMEEAMHRMHPSFHRDYRWIIDDVDCQLDRWGFTRQEFRRWCARNRYVPDLRLLFRQMDQEKTSIK